MDANGHASDLPPQSPQSREHPAFDVGVDLRCDLDVVSVNHEPHVSPHFQSVTDTFSDASGGRAGWAEPTGGSSPRRV